jgi:hypothetical protein
LPRALPYLGLSVRTEPLPEAGRGASRLAPLKRWAVIAGGTFWFGSLFTLFLASPFPGTYLMLPKPLATKLRTTAKVYKQLVYPWTGFSTHGVFVDEHFKDYRWQIRLVYRSGTQSVELPLVSSDGLCVGNNSGHIWELWAFRTVSPSLKIGRVEANLARFIGAWSAKSRVELERGVVDIVARPVEVSLTRWRRGLLADNLRQPWKTIGHARRDGGELRVEWLVARRAEERLAEVETLALALPEGH